jgi:hypothetical protein
VVLLFTVLAIVATGLGMLVLGEASDQRGKAHKAADAAALAAGVGARDILVRTMLSPQGVTFTSWAAWSGLAQGGCASAPGYAAANSSSTLTGCAYFPDGRVRADVNSAAGAREGLVAEASATADINTPTCTSRYYYVGKTLLRDITCVGERGTAMVTFNVGSGSIVYADPPQQWRRTFKVRLVA